MSHRTLLHIIGWIIFLILDNYQYYVESDTMDWWQVWIDLSYTFTLIITFYFLYSFIFPRFLKTKKWVPLIIGLLLSILVFCATRFLIQEFLGLHFLGGQNYNPKLLSVSFYLIDNWFRPLPIILASAFVYLFEAHNTNETEQQLLKQEKTDAELAFLRGQINPHFLFNSLHLIHTEAFEKDPELAGTILKVSDVLRYSVESEKAGKRTIQQEIDLMKDYIDIFKKRFDGKCFVNFKFEGNYNQQKIEPLLLIPFVENALKHGQFSDPNNPIQIHLKTEKGMVFFNTQNTIKRQTKDASSGVGVQNVRRRLEVLYPKQHELKIIEELESYKVDLRINL